MVTVSSYFQFQQRLDNDVLVAFELLLCSCFIRGGKCFDIKLFIVHQFKSLSFQIVPRIVNNPDEVVKKFEPAPAPAPGAGLNVDMWDLQTNNAAELAETALMEDMSKCLQMTYCIVGASTTTEDLKQLHSADQQQRVTLHHLVVCT